jgi:hypothetical protein
MDHSLSLDQDDPLLDVKSWKVLLLLLKAAAAAAAGSTTSVSAAALLHISESSSSSSSSYLHPNLSIKFKAESIHRETERQRT